MSGVERAQVTGLADWLIWQRAQRLSTRTISERVRVVQLFYTQTGVQPAHAQAFDVVEWLASHTDDWTESTTAGYQSCLSAWFKWLIIVDRRTDNPMTKVAPVRVPERQPRPIADADVPKLLATRMWNTTRVQILLGLLAGLRVSEIAAVRGEHVDLAAKLLWVRGKGRKLKSVPLHPVLIEIASEMPERGWWFPQRENPGEHVLGKSVSDVIGRTMRRAGVRGTPHSLRHWHATSLLDDGVDIRVVQELMRHKNIQSTVIYTRVTSTRQHQAVNGLHLNRGARQATLDVRIR